MGTVLQFPGAPREPDPEPEPEPDTSGGEPFSESKFLDWVYYEVLDFQTHVADLASDAEVSEDQFWSSVERVRNQINGWRRA